MTSADLSLEGLTYSPPPAAVRGDQTVWFCQQCGSVLVQSGYAEGRPAGACPACATHSWRKASLPIVGLDHRRCEACDRALNVAG